ncbi:hypothetical protein ABID16_004284 [Rhizobium aquaticum]|uniref:Uncharacterized protein n=1 Tax=Rhizobium aquaticum TaxID=1549636 RepID=A0ABV2J5A3_9HYPH
MAKPIGQKIMKPAIIATIHAGRPTSSSLVAMLIAASVGVNVNNIHIDWRSAGESQEGGENI